MIQKKQFFDLLALAHTLREKNPWHQKQRIETLSKHVLEEATEVHTAIQEKDWEEVQEEIGDLMWVLAIVAEVAQEKGLFSMQDSIDTIYKKIIRRNPHIFTGKKVSSEKEIRKQYLEIKQQEKKEKARKRKTQ